MEKRREASRSESLVEVFVFFVSKLLVCGFFSLFFLFLFRRRLLRGTMVILDEKKPHRRVVTSRDRRCNDFIDFILIYSFQAATLQTG